MHLLAPTSTFRASWLAVHDFCPWPVTTSATLSECDLSAIGMLYFLLVLTEAYFFLGAEVMNVHIEDHIMTPFFD